MANEIDAISDLSSGLEKLIDDPYTPPEIKKKAEFYQKMIELRPLQQSYRDKILANYYQSR